MNDYQLTFSRLSYDRNICVPGCRQLYRRADPLFLLSSSWMSSRTCCQYSRAPWQRNSSPRQGWSAPRGPPASEHNCTCTRLHSKNFITQLQSSVHLHLPVHSQVRCLKPWYCRQGYDACYQDRLQECSLQSLVVWYLCCDNYRTCNFHYTMCHNTSFYADKKSLVSMADWQYTVPEAMFALVSSDVDLRQDFKVLLRARRPQGDSCTYTNKQCL